MEITRATLETCGTATGCAVAIDVIRAFSTASYLFGAGVAAIYLVSTVEEAFALREAMPDCLLAGEVKGLPIQGFDFGNSPTAVANLDLPGKRVVQRTSAGTQGAVLAEHASVVLTGALTNLAATVRYIRKISPQQVTLIHTGQFPDGSGDEDVACADAIEDLLAGRTVDHDQITRRVRSSRSGRYFDGSRPDFPASDLDLALQFDRFGFAMVVTREPNALVLRPVQI